MTYINLLDQIDHISTANDENILYLSKLSADTNSEVRFRAIEKLTSLFAQAIPSSTLTKLITKHLDDADELVRCASLEFFEDHSSSVSLEKCVEMLKDKESIVRAQASRVIGNIKNSLAIPSLLKAIETAEDFEKVPLNFALFQLNPSIGLEPLLKLLDSPDHQARCAAANLLPIFKDSAFSNSVIERLTISLATDEIRSSKLAKSEALNELR